MGRLLSTVCFAAGMVCLSLAFSRVARADGFGFCTPVPCGAVPQNGKYCCGGRNEYGWCQQIPGTGCNLGLFTCRGTLYQYYDQVNGCTGNLNQTCFVPHNDNCSGHNY